MAVSMIGPKIYCWDKNGKPLAFGKLYTYQTRTNNPKPTFQSEDQIVENTNPVILNGEGYANVYLSGSYKMVLKDSDENEIWSSDPVSSSNPSEWVNCFTASYLSSTSISIPGNQVSEYKDERNLRIDNGTGDYAYTRVESASFASEVTNVTVTDPVITTGVIGVCTSITSTDSGAYNEDLVARNIGDYSKYSFSQISDIDVQSNSFLKEGDLLSVDDYEAGNNSGVLFFKVVAAGTGTDDGGKYIDLPTLGLQLEQNLKTPYNPKAWGAKGDLLSVDGAFNPLPTDDTVAFQAMFNYGNGWGAGYEIPQGGYRVNDVNPYGTFITRAKYASTLTGVNVNHVSIAGQGMAYTVLQSITGDVFKVSDPDYDSGSDPFPGRLSINVEKLSLLGDIDNQSSTKVGHGFYADTTEVSLSYTWFKDCLIAYFDRGYWYAGYEGTGPLSDGHATFENCIINNNNIGTVTAVDNVQYINCYTQRNNQYGNWHREGLNIEYIGGKVQLNGQDNFGTGDVFSHVGQIWVGGTTQRGEGVGNIKLNNLYMEATFETGNNPKHSFINVMQEDTSTRTMSVQSVTFDNTYVNGKDCENLIKLNDNCALNTLEIKANSVLNKFNLPGNRLVNLGSNARVGNGTLQTSKTYTCKNDLDVDIPSDLLRLLEPVSSVPEFNYNIQNQNNIKAAQIRATALGSGASMTTAVIVSSVRSIYRITVDDVYISGGDELVALPYIGLFIVTPDTTNQQDVLNTGYAFSVDGASGALVITNYGGARQFGYVIEKLL